MDDRILWKPREIEILRLLADGLTNQQIGQRLHLAPDTIRWYNKEIYAKLGVNSRAQAVHQASVLGVLDPQKRVENPKPAGSTPHRTPIRYVSNRDVHIAYLTIGEGPVDLLFIHGFLSHLELAWEEPEFAQFFAQLGQFARVILFDKRGVGLSDRIHGAATIEETIEDAISVLDAVGSEKTFVMGTSEGGAAAILLASMVPQRVEGLVLYATTPKVVQRNGEPDWAPRASSFQAFIDNLHDQWGGAWALENFAPSRAMEEPFRAWWSKILRSASSPSGVRAVLQAVGEVDIRELLPTVRVRTLIIHKSGDRMVPVEAGRYLAEKIPNAEFVELPGEDHIYFVNSGAIIAATAQFLRETPARKTIDTWIAIVMCVVTHEDGPPPGLLQTEINAFTPRHSIAGYSNVIAVFESPSQAIRCAQHLRDGRNLGALKIGLHVGECSLENGSPVPTVIEMSETASLAAAPGEIIITRTLRDILAGTSLDLTPIREPTTNLYSLA